MINLVYSHPDTGDDETWAVSFKEHSPFKEKRRVVFSDAGDYVEPDVIDKGSYDTVSLISNPIIASEINNFYLFRRGTRQGRPIAVDARVVPLIGVEYVGVRMGDLAPKSVHSGRYFVLNLNLRVIEVVDS